MHTKSIYGSLWIVGASAFVRPSSFQDGPYVKILQHPCPIIEESSSLLFSPFLPSSFSHHQFLRSSSTSHLCGSRSSSNKHNHNHNDGRKSKEEYNIINPSTSYAPCSKLNYDDNDTFDAILTNKSNNDEDCNDVFKIETSTNDLYLSRKLVNDFSTISSNDSSSTTIPSLSLSTVLFLRVLLLLMGTYGCVGILTDLLSQWEWIQDWRYTWPFGIGTMYVVANLKATGGIILNSNDAIPQHDNTMTTTITNNNNSFNNDSISMPTFMSGTSWITRILYVTLGIGLVVGGAYDVWMPVYETGPNVFTAAGIGQDAACALFFLTFGKVMYGKENTKAADSRREEILKSTSVTSKEQIESLHTSTAMTTDKSFSLLLQLSLQILLLAELYKLGEGSFDELFFSHFTF